MKAARRNHAQPPAQRGLSLVETLVGIAITLVVVAGALKMFVGHLEGNRRLLLEARLHQDLRAASDLIARDLRRAGYWQQASQGTSWPAQPNPYRAMTPSGTASAALTSYSYSRDATENNSLDSNESFGLRLSAGALQLLEGSGGWQQLTDAGTVLVTSLAITPQTRSIDLGHLCSPVCTSADPACPRLNLRHYDIVIQGRATSDASVTREVRESVRVRNDELPTIACP
jgi:prepilin peptidase dependent protein B